MWLSIVREYVVPVLSAVVTAGGIFMTLMRRAFVPRENFGALRGRVEKIEGRLDSLPTREDVHQLNVEIITLRGDLKAVGAAMRSISHQNELLLEQAVRKSQ